MKTHNSQRGICFYIWMTLTVIWFCLITFLSHQDGIRSTAFTFTIVDRSVTLREFFGEDTDLNEDERWSVNMLYRKAAHIGAFSVLSFLVFMTLTTGELKVYPGGAFCVVWSVLDELTKFLSAGRHAELLDIFLNLIGTALGVLIFMIFIRFKPVGKKDTDIQRVWKK